MRKWENKKDERHWNEEVGMRKAEVRKANDE
jgi:hypothetical protein